METVDTTIIGAGVIGLAIARELAAAGHEVIVLEAAEAIGTGTSSRNSEVIHAGIYYPAGSLMARFCVEGRRALYHYCAATGVAARNCGKLIVATSAEEQTLLGAIQARAEANGVEGMRLLTAAEARAMEPNLACTGALHSPTTGIIDSHAYMLALQGQAEADGAIFVFHSPLIAGHVTADGIEIRIGGADPMLLRTRRLINAAGLQAPDVARAIVGIPPATIPTAYYARGNYFTLTGRSPFARLIYPVPVPGGLGVHLTIDLAGQARFGPDVEWIDQIAYQVDPRRADSFYAAIRRYWPALPDGALQPGYAGIRPKILPPGGGAQDFVVQDRRTHGIDGLLNLYGIESPGLTASLALAAHVRDLAA